eukprot:TRINITY_DN2304_c0_g1_i2.p1 TRINITY_DN2304_c0_g1~~TRINITY_DN2304_c0_g1_i2.p1  ORF type:complete len:770 (-),score=242.21 TRINITY_DN2304_c0_g1_i2:135-2444(-)
MDKGKPTTQADKNRERLKAAREFQMNKKEQQINMMSDDQIVHDLKARGLPTFGTRQERVDRLKKAHGIVSSNNTPGSNQRPPAAAVPSESESEDEMEKKDLKGGKKDNVVDAVEKMKQAREERRLRNEEARREKAIRAAENEAAGRVVDVDFELMIEKARYREDIIAPHANPSKLKICICVRKRPLFKKEATKGEIDAVSVANPEVKVHECKLRVDGITKYVENHEFTFDNAFSDKEPTTEVYKYSIRPLIEFVLNEGIVTCFAYGQTGSGKTFTMKGIQDSVIEDMFLMAGEKYGHLGLRFYVGFFEIYGGRCYDLLNNKANLQILEDKNNEVQIQGLVEREAFSSEEMRKVIEYGNSTRTTHATVHNDTSSRSHAICQIILRGKDGVRFVGKLLLVDLAGSERAQDTQSNNRQRRLEGAEINKSLLALKECIRAMDANLKNGAANHVPFRASKLTLVLRDSFTNRNPNKTRIVMIACVSPGSTSADHTLNTLRYADRLKDRGITEHEVGLDYEEDEDFFEERKEGQVQQPPPAPKEAPQRPPAPSVPQKKPEPKPAPREEAKVKENKPAPAPAPAPVAAKDPRGNGGKPAAAGGEDGRRKGWGAPPPDKNAAMRVDMEKLPEREGIDDKESSSAEDDDKIVRENEDLKYMKETMKLDQPANKEANEFFDFHEKVNKIIEEQEQLFVTHMGAIKRDANLLTEESDLIANVQGMGEIEYDVDLYVQKLEEIIKKKLHMYNVLNKKLQKFKTLLKEEEEISSKVKSTFYY